MDAEKAGDLALDAGLKAIFDQMPGCWGCKDLNSVFMYANKEYARIIGFSPEDHLDIVGRTDFDMPCSTVNCADSFRSQDKTVMNRATKLQILDIHPFANGEWRAYIFTKTPMYNRNNEIVGTIFHGQDLTYSNIIALRDIISISDAPTSLTGVQGSILLTHKFCPIELTPREAQCLFFFLRGKSVKLIARYLHISPRTIENYMENLKYKFGASNKFDLFDKAIQAGFMNVIPEGLFSSQLSIVLQEE